MAPARAGTWQPFIWDRTCARPLATHPDDPPGNGLKRFTRFVSSLFGFAPGGVYRADHVTMDAVGSYPTLSPLPRRNGEAVCSLWHFPWGRPRRLLAGTVFPWSPDFPHPQPFDSRGCGRPAGWHSALMRSAGQTQGVIRRLRNLRCWPTAS